MFSDFLTRTLTQAAREGGCGMSTRPEYYSGRGATSTDLSSEKLETLYQAIRRNVNEKAADAFAQMVADIPCLSATDFLLALARLERNAWVWDARLIGMENGIYAGTPEDALFTLFEVVGHGDDHHRDETTSIRWGFLRQHGLKDPKVKPGRRSCYDDPYGYGD